MKKAIKVTAILAALSLVFSAFTACSIGTPVDTTTTTVPTETSQTTTEPSTEEFTTESTTEETSTEAETCSIEEILKMIKTFPVGTAGSSAKCFDIALKLINFTESCDDTSALEAEIDKFSDTLSDRQKAMFEESFAEIDYVARKLIAGESDNYKGYIESSSEKYDKGNYSLEKYEAVFKMLSDI